MSITVLNPGLLTTVQDLGRVGYQQFGVSVSGVMDPRATTIANILVNNPDGEAVLECTMMGPHLQFNKANCIAITGPSPAMVLHILPLQAQKDISEAEEQLDRPDCIDSLRRNSSCNHSADGSFEVFEAFKAFKDNCAFQQALS